MITSSLHSEPLGEKHEKYVTNKRNKNIKASFIFQELCIKFFLPNIFIRKSVGAKKSHFLENNRTTLSLLSLSFFVATEELLLEILVPTSCWEKLLSIHNATFPVDNHN